MSRTSTAAKFLGFASAMAVAAVIGAASASAGDLVVAAVKGIDLPLGSKIDGAQILTLKAGQKVTLISADGKSIKLSGPYEQAPAPETVAGGLSDSLKGLISAQGAGTANLGVTRSAGDKHALPETWVIDVSSQSNGDRCILADADRMVLWSPSPVTNPSSILRSADKSFEAKFNWRVPSDRMAIPLKNVKLKDGETYEVVVGGQTSALTFHVIPATASTDAVRAAWMVEKGCQDQASVLVKSIAQ